MGDTHKKLGRPITMQEPFRTLAEKAGGAVKLAMEIGTSRRSLNRWGIEPAPGRIARPYRILLAQVAEKHGMSDDLRPWTLDPQAAHSAST
jgi:hypothetical protein